MTILIRYKIELLETVFSPPVYVQVVELACLRKTLCSLLLNCCNCGCACAFDCSDWKERLRTDLHAFFFLSLKTKSRQINVLENHV